MIFNHNAISIVIVLAFSMASVDAAISAAPVRRRTCFTEGTVGSCQIFTADFCNSLKTAIAFGNNHAGCYNAAGFKCDFGAFFEFSADAAPLPTVPSEFDCNGTLENVTVNCNGLGGFGNTNAGAFTFTMDPNQGQCGQLEASSVAVCCCYGEGVTRGEWLRRPKAGSCGLGGLQPLSYK
ncbi:hypothetical protein BDQ12DRAFT_760888 [Crucibulum laeve]|uniref:Glycan binding protein Y3-like domain-containing protein n=1 Tax=Crucibulum laeve TaxID=68775 RepID=A0A5C3LRM2_9AGAR|nr:hypothetical protein BDQ12DRAFT_760888 [Crucibulum laeve]